MRAEFDDSLVTGNEMIDSQHRELIDKINKLLARGLHGVPLRRRRETAGGHQLSGDHRA